MPRQGGIALVKGTACQALGPHRLSRIKPTNARGECACQGQTLQVQWALRLSQPRPASAQGARASPEPPISQCHCAFPAYNLQPNRVWTCEGSRLLTNDPLAQVKQGCALKGPTRLSRITFAPSRGHCACQRRSLPSQSATTPVKDRCRLYIYIYIYIYIGIPCV